MGGQNWWQAFLPLGYQYPVVAMTVADFERSGSPVSSNAAYETTAADGSSATNVQPLGRAFTLVIYVSATMLFIVHAVLSFPGVLTYDSKMQYAQALSGKYSDWHPPVMAILWHGLLPFAVGGGGLLILHLALYWISLTLIAASLADRDKPWFAVAVMAAGVLPNLALLSTFIHKDVGMAVALTTAFALILRKRCQGQSIDFGYGCMIAALLGYATLVRSNAAFATAPMALYAWYPAVAHGRYLLIKMIAFPAAIVALAVPTSGLINHHLLKAQDTRSAISIILYDLAGIAHFSRDPSIYPAKVPSLTLVDRCYDPYMWDPINQGECAGEIGTFNGVAGSARAKAWPKAIISHPIAYAEHRLVHFNQELAAFMPTRYWSWGPYADFTDLPPGRIEAFTYRAADWFEFFPVTAPITSLVLALSVFCIGAMRRSANPFQQASFFLSTAAVLYTFGFALVGVASMYRYHQFLMMAALLSAILMIAGSLPAERHRVSLAMAVFVAGAIAMITAARFLL
jgi:hypothetical protein